MKPTRIHKINGVDQNVIFQMLNDKSIALICLSIAGLITFFYGAEYPMRLRIVFVMAVGLITYALTSISIEGQKLNVLIPKFFGYVYTPKKLEKLSTLEFKTASDIRVLHNNPNLELKLHS